MITVYIIERTIDDVEVLATVPVGSYSKALLEVGRLMISEIKDAGDHGDDPTGDIFENMQMNVVDECCAIVTHPVCIESSTGEPAIFTITAHEI